MAFARGGLGVVLLALAVAVTGCSGDDGPVSVDAAPLSGTDARVCRTFLDSLPTEIAGLSERPVTPSDAPARAWGSEGMVLTCGAPQPPDITATSRCEIIRGVGWYFPPSQYDVSGVDLLATAVGYRPRVSLLVPAAYRGDVSLEVFSDLSDYVKPTLTRLRRCL